MADLKDILQGVNPDVVSDPPNNPDFIAVQPNLSDDTFYSDILDELNVAEIIDFDFSNAHRFHLVGSKSGDEDEIGLNSAETVGYAQYRNVFIGQKGSIGKYGDTAVFPYISNLPYVGGMTDEQIAAIFGGADLTPSTPSDTTQITIGGKAKGVAAASNQYERVFVGDIIIVGNFPALEPNILDLDNLVTHEQGSENAIVVSESRVDIYPPSVKRTINIGVCGEGLARAANTSSNGELRAFGPQSSCVNGIPAELYPPSTSNCNLIRTV